MSNKLKKINEKGEILRKERAGTKTGMYRAQILLEKYKEPEMRQGPLE